MWTSNATRELCVLSMAQVLSVNVYIRTLVMVSLANFKILAFHTFVMKMQHVCFTEVLVWDQEVLVLDQQVLVWDQEVLVLDQGCLDQDQQFLVQD